jgi:hypothetical protein
LYLKYHLLQKNLPFQKNQMFPMNRLYHYFQMSQKFPMNQMYQTFHYFQMTQTFQKNP